MIGHSKRILFIGIHDFDALVLQEKHLFPPFFRILDRLLKQINMDSHNYIHSLHAPLGCMILMPWFRKKSFFPPFFVDQSSSTTEMNMDSHNYIHFFLDWASKKHSPHWDTRY